jgi:hypothetical protein
VATTTDAERAIGDGAPLLINGIQRRLIFGFAALKVLETDFGGIMNWLDHFAPGGLRTRRMTAIETGVRAGLTHYELEGAGAHFDVEAAVASVVGELTGEGWQERVDAVVSALDAAYGQGMPPRKRPGKSSAQARRSPGPSSSAAPSSTSGSSPAEPSAA